jgi:MtN3 and saliva related transmembrane protein
LDATTALGYLAGTLTTIAFVPQVLKIHKTKSANDVSLRSFSVFCVGVALWLLYGIRMGEFPIIVTNGITLVLAIAILVLKIRYRHNPPAA